uniref:Uncharacterized protein n=1 Tax=Fagus sylvatica TaxID=28930 RepID=A0A2N9EA87_FAGSY
MCWHALSTCWRVGGAAGTATGPWRRVAAPVKQFFAQFFRSEDEEPYGGVHCSIRCSEEWVLRPLGRLRVVARGASCRSFDRHVEARETFDDDNFLGFDRSGDDLLNGSPHSYPNSLYRSPQTAPIVTSKNSGSKGIRTEPL